MDPQQLKTEPIMHFDFTVEFGDSRNRNMNWPLTQRQLRGRWSRNNLPGITFEGAPEFSGMPDIPGLRLSLSSVKKTSKIFDVLENEGEDPRLKAILEKAQRVLNAVFSVRFGPEPTVELKDLSGDELKSHAYWVRRILDNRSCTVISGRVPSMDEIVSMPGLIKMQNHDSSPLVVHDQPAPRRYIPVRFFEDEGKDSIALDPANDFLYEK